MQPVDLSSQYFTQLEQCIDSPQNAYSQDARTAMHQVVTDLKKQGFCIREGDDSLRAPFVGLQGAMEHVLAGLKTSKVITNLMGAIHTPVPATPLCAQVDGKNIENLMDPSIWKDQDKCATVKERAITIRLMLSNPETVLYAIFAQGGLQKRKLDEQQIFQQEVANHKNLRTVELKTAPIDPAYVGALYYFTDEKGTELVIAIKAQQANSPLEKSIWGIWFGTLTNPDVQKREQEVTTYLVQQGGPNLHQEFVDLCKANVKETSRNH